MVRMRPLPLALGLTALIITGCGASHSGGARSPEPHSAASRPGATSPAPSSSTAAAGPSHLVASGWLVGAIEGVSAGSPVFGLRDTTGAPMQTLKVVASPVGYLGVYHCVRAGIFEVRLATSSDLRAWTFRSVLDTHASQPTLAGAGNGSYVLAVEADNGAGPGPGRRFLRFRYYPDVMALLAGRAARTFDAPHRLAAPSRGAEGTPNIYSVRTSPDVTHSQIAVGFHYLIAGVDREARGELTDFRFWKARPDGALDRALLAIGLRGKHGDRDAIATTSGTLVLVECQDADGLWRLAAYDAARHIARLLTLRTPGGSRSFANPAVSYVPLSAGASEVVMTAFLPQTGSARGENGELLYVRHIPARAAIAVPGSTPTPQGAS